MGLDCNLLPGSPGARFITCYPHSQGLERPPKPRQRWAYLPQWPPLGLDPVWSGRLWAWLLKHRGTGWRSALCRPWNSLQVFTVGGPLLAGLHFWPCPSSSRPQLFLALFLAWEDSGPTTKSGPAKGLPRRESKAKLFPWDGGQNPHR